jgi:hypothetical protein
MLLAAFDERRPTGDVDPLAENISNDAETISRLIREILAIRVDDGVAFEPDGFRVAVIREADPSTGVRITVPASIARARHPLRIDVNIGDPVTPAPVEIAYPTLLGEPFEILGYPIETVLAEKVVTMVDRGDATTRERDFADVLILTRRHALNAAPSAKPSRRLEHTAARISVRFDRSWSSWHRRASPTGSDSSTPADRRGTLERSVQCRSGGHSALQDHPTDAPGAAHGGRDVVDAAQSRHYSVDAVFRVERCRRRQ